MSEFSGNEGLKLLFNELGVGVMLIGRDDGIIRVVNDRACKDVGRTADELAGRHYRQVFWPEFIPVYDRLITACEDGKEHTAIYYWSEMALWEQISARVIIWNGEPALLFSSTNISEVARSEYRFENMAYFDNLLKLPNGAKLEEDLNVLANLEAVTIIYFEIEHFEDINNLYGWDNGDNLLRQIRDWLLCCNTFRAQLYRVNNGFAFLARRVTLEEAWNRCLEIQDRFTKPWTLSAGGNSLLIYCTVRLGIVFGKYVKNEMRNLLMRTIRVARETNTGYAVYDEVMDKRTKRSLELRDSLINCVLNDMKGFAVHYQPIVYAKTQRWVALEALCRWTAPGGENVSPATFIPLAEQLGLIDQVDRWVRRTAMRQCVELGLDRKQFVLDVNFSPTQHIDDTFVDTLLVCLHETGFPAHMLNLEITESARMLFDERNLNGLNRLREHGIILSLDDFGTGYSSFANLFKVSAHALKTDKLFLERIECDPHRQYLLRMLVDIAHYLDMRLIAEGVETEEQLELLKQCGVDYFQGEYFSMPIPFDLLRHEVGRFRDQETAPAAKAPPPAPNGE